MNNKRDISFSTASKALVIAILVIVSCSGLIAVANEVIGSDEIVAAEMNNMSAIPNLDLNNFLLDSSIQEASASVVKNQVSQKPINAATTIISQSTAISLAFNCPDRTSKTVLVPEPTIFPKLILKLIPNYFGTDFHEIEFSLYATFNKLNDQGNAGLGFDFYGNLKTIGTLLS